MKKRRRRRWRRWDKIGHWLDIFEWIQKRKQCRHSFGNILFSNSYSSFHQQTLLQRPDSSDLERKIKFQAEPPKSISVNLAGQRNDVCVAFRFVDLDAVILKNAE